MSSWIDSLNVSLEHISASARWLRVVNLLCLSGCALATLSLLRHWKQHRAVANGGTAVANPFAKLTMLVLTAAIVVGFVQVSYRYVEVNHFPSQTMSEVLVMFSLALLVSMFVLHFAMRMHDMGPGWATVDDALLGIVLFGAFLTNHYSSTLSTAQKDLPPALQSYWFPPHLSALMISYATLAIAGVLCIVYFCMRFWNGVLSGGQTLGSQIVILLGLLLVPFGHFVTIPILVVTGLVFLVLKRTGDLPQAAAMGGLEKTVDQVSYRAFSVGIPFLTAGLFMGAFWAQEAWANYWGWDSKENSALITWLVYVVYVHVRMLGGFRGEKAMAVLAAGALSVFFTFQIFGYLPDSQKSLHRYTDDNVVPREGMSGATEETNQSARLEETR